MIALITRPALDAPNTAKKLNQHNVETLTCPMIEIEWATDINIDISQFQHIIFTSKNGVRSFCNHSTKHNLIAWCVGDETADFANKNGFSTVFSAKGTAADLSQLIKDKTSPQPMLRVTRLDQTDKLSAILNNDGYAVTSLPLYRTTPINGLSTDIIKALKDNRITDILFYSPYTARITVKNIQASNVGDACRKITAWCISKKTGAALDALSFKDVIIADKPNEQALLEPLITRKTQQ